MNLEITTGDLTKVKLDEIAYGFIEPVIEGNANAIEQWAIVKAISEVADRCLKDADFKDTVLKEIEKYGKEGVSFSGAKFELHNSSKLDYTECGDPVYKALKEQEKALTDKIKEREAFLKTIPYAGLEFIDDATGEVCKIFAPQKLTTTSPKVTFAK